MSDVRIPWNGRLLAAGVFLICSLGYVAYSLSYEIGTPAAPGPAMVPIALGPLWVMLSAINMAGEWRTARGGAPCSRSIVRGELGPLALIGAGLVYLLSAARLGHLPAMAIMLWLSAFVSQVKPRLGRIILVALSLAALYLIFQKWLNMPLPRGMLGA